MIFIHEIPSALDFYNGAAWACKQINDFLQRLFIQDLVIGLICHDQTRQRREQRPIPRENLAGSAVASFFICYVKGLIKLAEPPLAECLQCQRRTPKPVRAKALFVIGVDLTDAEQGACVTTSHRNKTGRRDGRIGIEALCILCGGSLIKGIMGLPQPDSHRHTQKTRRSRLQ